jgi:ElaB/YqjD/DUF883 family membrane-anchored ribosome-binding protein
MSQAPVAVSKEKLMEDFTAVIAEAEQLLDTVKVMGGGKAGELRADVDKALAAAGARLSAIREQSAAQASAAARATEEYVHENPWSAIGSAALVGMAAGLVLGVVIARR